MVYATNSAGYQAIPTEQPLAEELYTETPTADLGGWSLEAFLAREKAAREAQSALSAYIAQQGAAGKNYTSPIGDPLTNSVMPGLAQVYGAAPQEQALRYFTADTRDSGALNMAFNPNTYTGGYQLVDPSGKVLSAASTPDQLEALLKQAESMGGAKDAYAIQGIRPGDLGPDTLYQQTPKETLGDMLVKMAAIAGPAAGGALLGPALAGVGGLGIGVSPAVGVGLGTAIGSAAAGTLAGKSIGDILTQAALSGVTAGGLQALSGGLPGGPLNNVSHSGVANAIGSGANNAITVIGNAASAAAPSFAGGLANSLYSGSNNAPASNASPGGLESNFDGIIVKGASNGSLLGGPGALASGFPSTLQGALSAAQPGYANLAGQMPTEDIVAEGVRQQGLSDVGKTLVGGAALAGAGVAAAPSGGATSSAGASATEAAGGSAGAGTLSQISKYLEMAGYGTSVLGALFGGKGGGSGSAGTIPGGFGGVNPVFKTTLPQANLPGVGDMSPRVMPQQDWNTYAMRPEQSFFNNVPQNVQGYADGGDVRGPGTGRSDSIPAALSDGEYVMDAETVALLGDGSTNAGADMLDQFRINIRKHKGKHLSKGKISPDAKAPEHYLSGGLA